MNQTNKSNTLSPNTWVDAYADYLFNYAVARVNDSNIAKDLVQETFFAGLKSAKNFQGKSTERTWLVSILKRKLSSSSRLASLLESETTSVFGLES